MPSITVICRDSSVKNMICWEIMNAFRPKQRQSMWLKYIFYIVSVCRRCTFDENSKKSKERYVFFFYQFAMLHAFLGYISIKEASVVSFVDMPIFGKVKRYQNHKQRNARRLKCYSIVKCFRESRNSKIWPNLYAMFFFYNRQSESIA